MHKHSGRVLDIGVTKDYELKNLGTRGAGIQYNYVFIGKNGEIQNIKTKFIKNNVYGIYAGSKNPKIPKEGHNYKLLTDDYNLEPIDQVDKLAKDHDLAYDEDELNGLRGVLSKRSSPANNNFINGIEKVNEGSRKGDCDPVSKNDYSKKEVEAGNWASAMFKRAEKLKALFRKGIIETNPNQDEAPKK